MKWQADKKDLEIIKKSIRLRRSDISIASSLGISRGTYGTAKFTEPLFSQIEQIKQKIKTETIESLDNEFKAVIDNTKRALLTLTDTYEHEEEKIVLKPVYDPDGNLVKNKDGDQEFAEEITIQKKINLPNAAVVQFVAKNLLSGKFKPDSGIQSNDNTIELPKGAEIELEDE